MKTLQEDITRYLKEGYKTEIERKIFSLACEAVDEWEKGNFSSYGESMQLL